MPRAKRVPIDYKPQFGAGIFRSPDEVAEELAGLVPDAAPNEPDTITENEEAVRSRRSRQRDGQSHDRTNYATSERTNERTRVRHSFDIYHDHLLALTEIQTRRFTTTGRKPKLGELVQEALDAYIGKQQTNVRTNERSSDRKR